MQIIAIASSKGGSGKTTIATATAGEIARRWFDKGVTVALVDADPNQHSAKWAKREGCPKNIQIVKETNELYLGDTIDEIAKKVDFVIVDLEGIASLALSPAISRASLVIIPFQGSQDDADEAFKTIKLIRAIEGQLGHQIPFALLPNRTSTTIQTKGLKHILAEFGKSDIYIFKTSLIDREALRTVRALGGTVNDLDCKKHYGADKASQNVESVVDELLMKLKDVAHG